MNESIVFEDYQSMLRKIAFSFRKTTGLEYEDLLSEAYLSFVLSRNTWDSRKGFKFSTWCYKCAVNHLGQFCIKQRNMNQSTISPFYQSLDYNPYSFIELKNLIETLSEDSMEVVKIVFNCPDEILENIRKKNTDNKMKKEIASFLRSKEWTDSRITEAFHEIRDIVNGSN